MNARRWITMAVGALVALGSAEGARGQGFVVEVHTGINRPPRPVARSFEIREVTVDARIRDQVAEVSVAQTFHNPGSTEIESEYLFPLPEGAAVQNLVLMVDGKELPGRLLPRDEARRIYEEIVRSRRDPALLEYMGQGMFRTSVFPIPPGADRKVTLRYTQLCRRERDVVEFLYPLGTQKFSAKPIRKLSLTVRVDGRDPIKSVYCPGYGIDVTRPTEREARTTLERTDFTPSSDFRLVYSLGDGALGATILSTRPSDGEDGYFLLLASPEVKPLDAQPAPKTVVFVIDRSGSMAGKKIEQAKAALQSVLNNLRDDDTFNIIAYDDRVEAFKPELQRFTPSSRADAERFVANIREGGSTNIDDALRSAMGMISDDARPAYVIFLTDGLPTAGERGELRIAANARGANKAHARIFAFGVGFDVNARLLDRLGAENAGTSEYVRPDEDIEAHVSSFYSKMTRPALTSIAIELAGTDVNRTYPRDLPDLFSGGQLVWSGRYRRGGPSTIRISGKVAGERRTFEFPAELASPGSGSSYDFVEKLWAVRRVGAIIDQIDLNGPSKELTDELVALSTRYGLLTPYTSFLADERTNLHARAENLGRAAVSLNQLSEVGGAGGTAQRAGKQVYLRADRFDDAKFAFTPLPSNAPIPLGLNKAAIGGIPAPASAPLAAAPGMPGLKPAAEPARSLESNVRQVGSKTFFRKANRWVDAEVKAEDEAKAIVIEQFSEPFFQLAREQTSSRNQYFSFEEPVTVELGGKIYRIEPPKAR
jgi:Ca-activated chloride channel family protein